MASNNWVWELAEHYPVKPVAAIVQRFVPNGESVHTSFPDARPSLSFYSDRPVIPASLQKLKRIWKKEAQPYLLLDKRAIASLNLKENRVLGKAEGWMLVTKIGKGQLK